MSFNFWNLGFTKYLFFNLQGPSLSSSPSPKTCFGKGAKILALVAMVLLVVLFVLIEKELASPLKKKAQMALSDPALLPLKGAEKIYLTYYQVQRGDTLPKIAKKYYGHSQKWRKILRANDSVLKGPTHLRVGMRLYIPPQNFRKYLK